jgi:hypothetical protein
LRSSSGRTGHVFPDRPRDQHDSTGDPERERGDEHRGLDQHAPADPKEREREHAGAHERRDGDSQGRRDRLLREHPERAVGPHEIPEAVDAADRLHLQLRDPRAIRGDQRLHRPRGLREIESVDATVGIH